MENLSLYFDMVKMKDGKIIKKYRKKRCHSFVKQFLQFLFNNSMPQTSSLVDTSGATIALGGKALCAAFAMNVGVNQSITGSVVGTDDTPVAVTDYALVAKINHGTGSGQLQYSVQTFGAPSTDAAGTTFIASRVFTNISGNTVTIKEIGMIVYVNTAKTSGIAYGTTYYFLIARDVLTSPVAVANGETLTLNYTFTTTI